MSNILRIVPVILLLLVLGGAGYIGYQIYLYANGLAQRGQRSMAKHNINFTTDGGMRVGVKELGNEEYSQRTQNVIVKAWQLSSWPQYKSRFWNQEADINKRRGHSANGSADHSRTGSPAGLPAGGATARPAAPRHASSRGSTS